jgi:hypothetical protein
LNQIVTITDTKDGMVSYKELNEYGDYNMGGTMIQSFVAAMNKGDAVPVGLKQVVKTENESKIEVNVKPTSVEVEESKAEEETEAREGYFNEKPSEILNVGRDVWGARRHNFDTYSKFSTDVSALEKDGTANAYVTKKNLLGDYGLADKDQRVANGETEFKALASYAIKDALLKCPPDKQEDREKYFEFCRAITRYDQETSSVVDFFDGLAQSFANLFPAEVADKASPKTAGLSLMSFAQNKGSADSSQILGAPIRAVLKTLNGSFSASDSYSLERKDKKKMISMMDCMISEKNPSSSLAKNYDEIKTDMLGTIKALGVKVKKGDNIILAGALKDKVFISTSTFASEEEKTEFERIWEVRQSVMNFMDIYHYYWQSKPERRKEIFDYFGKEFESKEDARIAIQNEARRLRDEAYKHIVVTKYYPEGVGQVAKAGKDKLHVCFKFPDNTIKTFSVDPRDVKEENIESIKKSAETKSNPKIVLYIEKNVTRKGGKDFNKISIAEAQSKLEKDFGFKAVQYGNSMPDTERQHHTQWTLEAFSDLSEVLNIPSELLTARNKLGIAFGARGVALGAGIGGAAAHYEANTKMINLTRANGYGSLAHEWGHFMDNILSPSMHDFITGITDYNSKRMKVSDITVHGTVYEVKNNKGKVTKRYFYDANAKNKAYPFALLKAGQTEPDGSSRYSGFRSYATLDVQEPVYNPKFDLAREIALKSRDSVISQGEEMKARAQGSNDVEAIDKIDLILGKAYYTNMQETFARAFECYIADKMEKSNRQNTYLVSKLKTTEGNAQVIYPQGKAREELYVLFDKFFDHLRASGDLKKALEKFNKQKNVLIKSFDREKGVFVYRRINS